MKPTIHVVDDDASTRRALIRLIHALGFEVDAFESAEAFLGSEHQEEKACLLVDIHMPGMSGVELCRHLAESGRRLPTILMSAHRDPNTRALAAGAHPVATLYKPFDEEALMNAIRLALGSAH
jgi:FixJ family two-component response regulator